MWLDCTIPHRCSRCKIHVIVCMGNSYYYYYSLYEKSQVGPILAIYLSIVDSKPKINKLIVSNG